MGCAASIAFKTVEDGDSLAVTSRTGRVCIVDGPAMVMKWGGRSFRKLPRHVAGEDEYLVVQFTDGRTELLTGPAALFEHPVHHQSVTLHQGLRIGEQEVVVIYRREHGGVRRRLVHGPGIYIPDSVTEWTHEFAWTGAAIREGDPGAAAAKRVGALKFKTLRTSPAKSYFDVQTVRTKDNALITVKLMLFFSLMDVERMLDATVDPPGDLFNAVSADVIEWCATRKFDEFLASTETLNQLGMYTQLCAAAEQIGMRMDKVVFRGYEAPAALQKMHDAAIEKRTAFLLAKESEEEQQSLKDFKLEKEAARSEREAQLEADRLRHQLALELQTQEAKQQQLQREHALELERRVRDTEQDLQRLRGIKELDPAADLGHYVTARDCPAPHIVQCGSLLSAAELAADRASQRERLIPARA